eukprot:6213268-Alexandrium_andersonii.AAC.1
MAARPAALAAGEPRAAAPCIFCEHLGCVAMAPTRGPGSRTSSTGARRRSPPRAASAGVPEPTMQRPR